MKKLHQLFIFLSIISSAFCLSADTESTKASTQRFLDTHGTKMRQKIQIVLPKKACLTESEKACLFISLDPYKSDSPQRLAISLEETNSQFHGVSPLGTPEPKSASDSQNFIIIQLDHGVSPLGTESPRK